MSIIAFLDTETLGLDPDLHAVWEIGLVRYDTDAKQVRSEHLWQIRLTPEQIAAGDSVGMKIGGFDERYGRDAPPSNLMGVLAALVALTDGCHLAGNVVSFDEERLRRLCLANGFRPRWHYHLIDVENLAVGYLAATGRGVPLPWRSDDLCEQLDIEISEADRHTALGDARWAMRTYEAVMAVAS